MIGRLAGLCGNQETSKDDPHLRTWAPTPSQEPKLTVLPPALSALLALSAQPMAVLVEDGWHANDALLDLIGISAPDRAPISGTLLWGDDAAAVAAAAGACQAAGTPSRLDIGNADAPDGSGRCLRLSLAPLQPERAGLEGVHLFAHDATDAVRERRGLRITLDVIDAARQAETARAAMQAVARSLADHWEVRGAGFAELRPDGTEATVEGEWARNGVSVVGRYFFAKVPATAPVVSGAPLILKDRAAAALDPRSAALLDGLGIASLAVVALPRPGRSTIALFLHDDAPHQWRREDIELLQALLLRSSALFDRRRTEAEAQAAKERLDLIEADGALGMFDWELGSDVHHWSPGLWRLLGRSEVDGMPSNELFGQSVHPDDREAAMARLHEALAEGDRLLHDYRIIRPDGRIRHASTEGLVARGPDARPVRVTGIVRDVTERQLLREADARDAFEATLRDQLRVPTDPLDTMVTAARTLAGHFGVSRVGYAEVDESGEVMLNRRDLAHPERDMLEGRYPLANYGAAVAAELKAGRTLVIHDVVTDPRTHAVADVYRGHGIGAIISVPIMKGGRLVATFDINDIAPHRWTPDEVAACEIAAERIAAAAERARADRAVRENERLLRAIGDATTDLIFAKDLEGRLIYANEATLKLLGLDWAEAEGLGPAQMAAIDAAADPHARNDAAVFASGDVGIFEEDFTGADGVHRIFLSTKAPMRDAAGRTIGLAGVAHDVTDLREAESALRESESRFRTLADNIPALCWMAHPDGDIFWYNRKWYDYTGTTLDEMCGWGWQQVHDPEFLPLVKVRWQHSIDTRTPFAMVFPIRAADGSFRPFLTRVAPVFDQAGQLLRWFGTNTDVSELQTLRRTEALHDLILESATDVAILTTDEQGLVTSWNAGASALFGRPAARMLGRHSDLLFPADAGEADGAAARATALASGRWTHEGPMARRGGDVFWASAVLTPLRDPEGRPHGYLMIARDRSPERRQEEHRRLLVDELNHRVKNTLAIVQGTAHQTFRSVPAAAAALKTFDGRLAALASAHQVLTRENWESSDLGELIAALRTTQDPDGRRILVEGPAVRLDPQTAVTVTMVLHELVTNARKYGALSGLSGVVHIGWTRTQGAVDLEWTESGGPPVAAAPPRGFGSRMIERAFPSSGENRAALDFQPDGVRCRLRLVERPVGAFLQPGRGMAA